MYTIEELAELGGVSRRTIRYYIQQGLIPEPNGRGPGKHYSQEHLEILLKVKQAQQEGKTLEEIKQLDKGIPGPSPPNMSAWIHIEVQEDVYLQIRRLRIPEPEIINQLVTAIKDILGKDNVNGNSKSENK